MLFFGRMRLFSGCLGSIIGLVLAAVVSVLDVDRAHPEDAPDFIAMLLRVVPIGLIVGAAIGAWLGVTVRDYWIGVGPTGPSQTRKAIVVGLVSFGVIACLTVVCASMIQRNQWPSDASMIAHFEQNRTSFEDLESIIRSNASPDRAAMYRRPTYRKVLERIGVRDSLDGRFAYWRSRPPSDGMTVKGYAFRMEPPEGVAPSLDRGNPYLYTPFIAYRRIRGNWYLFFEYHAGHE